MSEDPPRPRRALSGLRGGPVVRAGDAVVAELLAGALDLVGGEEPGELTHGFHSYPARFHPELARRLLAARPDAREVLDPFVGSGTTLVEASLAGRKGHGVDINPLAVTLTRLKATAVTRERLELLVRTAASIAAASTEASRAARRSAGRTAPRSGRTRFDDPRHYPPHVFRELVFLRTAIDEACPEPPATAKPDDVRVIDERAEWLRSALLLSLSSIVLKVSLVRSDTDHTTVERTIARGAATRLFADRVEELAARLDDFSVEVAPGTPNPDVRVGDARKLTHIATGTIDLIITSPPYLGTYDYAEHHARRFGWLGLDPRMLFRHEIGARRKTTDEGAALRQWSSDVDAFVGEMTRTLSLGGWAFVLVGDSALGHRAIAGDLELRRALKARSLQIVATAAQARPDVYGPTRGHLGEKREHLFALQRR